MMKTIYRKMRSDFGGVNRLVLIFIIAIVIMLVLIAVPWADAIRQNADRNACEMALKSASDGLVIDYLDSFKNKGVSHAQLTLQEVMPGRDNLCPTGGTVYLIKGDNGVYKPICGIHDRDEKERARLNASYAKSLLEEQLTKMKKRGQEIPDTVKITINGKTLVCERVEELPPIRTGTSKMVDYDGIVSFFTLDDEDELQDFLYADEACCAKYLHDGWSGDAYS